MASQEQIKAELGRERYFQLRDEGWSEWKRDGKARGVSSRYYIHNFIEAKYKEGKESEIRRTV